MYEGHNKKTFGVFVSVLDDNVLLVSSHSNKVHVHCLSSVCMELQCTLEDYVIEVLDIRKKFNNY